MFMSCELVENLLHHDVDGIKIDYTHMGVKDF